MFTTAEEVSGRSFATVIVGSGFGAAFFARQLLADGGSNILILEWGRENTHAEQLEMGRNSDIDVRETYRSASPKPWRYTVGLGGGTNCWYAQAPRFHPNDFRLASQYGVGRDWPVSYDELETWYGAAETVMSISGDPDMDRVLPRSTPFPQPPHRGSLPDRMMKAAQPDLHFIIPTARARIATETRPGCCASLRCWLCPVNAKFTAENGLHDTFDDPRVSVVTGAEVRTLDVENGVVRRAVFASGGREHTVSGDLFVLGANGIQSPAILDRSGHGGGLVGRGLHEQLGHEFEVFLDGVDNFDGSTITTGLNYSLYDGEHRRTAGATLLYFENRWKFGLRAEQGRMRQILPVTIAVEDLPQDDNRVTADPDGTARVTYGTHSTYADAGLKFARENLERVLAPLPVERIADRGPRGTEAHVQGSLRMGDDPATSVVDAGQVHHRLRNLVVVGSSVFPSGPAANPSLTIAAMSMRAASLLAGRA